MIGGDLGAVKDMLAGAFKRASEAKIKAEGGVAASVAASAATPRKDTTDPAFLLSASLEDLTGRLRDMSRGASDGARDGIARADTALGQMEGILSFTEEFAKQLDSVMEAMERDLDRTLKALGMGEDERRTAAQGFRDRFGPDARAQAVASFEERTEASSVSVEVQNIELTVGDGDRSLTISFDRSALSLSQSRSESALVTDGDSLAFASRSESSSLNLEKQGVTVDARGFTDEELSGLMDQLGKQMRNGTLDEALEGLATLTPASRPADGEAVTLSLDLKNAIKDTFANAGADAGAGKDGAKAFDILA